MRSSRLQERTRSCGGQWVGWGETQLPHGAGTALRMVHRVTSHWGSFPWALETFLTSVARHSCWRDTCSPATGRNSETPWTAFVDAEK